MKRWLCVGLRKGSMGYSFIFLILSFSVPFLGQASFFFRVNERLLVHLEDISHSDRHSLLLFVVTLLSISSLDIE